MASIALLMSIMSTLGRRLKALRLAAGLSQEQLGIEAGLDPASASARMNRYELGKRLPDPATLELLAKALSAPAAYFHASSDELADLILRYYRLPMEGRRRLKLLLDELESRD
jgi:transcriptional regulator with XRE-family HTH domain